MWSLLFYLHPQCGVQAVDEMHGDVHRTGQQFTLKDSANELTQALSMNSFESKSTEHFQAPGMQKCAL